MSLEQALQENTAALRALTAVLTVSPPAKALTPAASAPAESAASAPAESAKAEAPATVTRESAKELAKKLNVKDSQKLKAILTELGAANFSAVPDDKLVEFAAKCEEVLK